MIHWLDDLARVLSQGQAAVSVAVASTRGSVPRAAGTRMVVTSAGVFGTLGGGHLEFKAIQIARDMLFSGGVTSLMRFPLGASLGQCCGGLVTLLFEPVAPGAKWVDEFLGLRQRDMSFLVVSPVRGSPSAGRLVVAGEEIAGSLGSSTLDSEAVAIAKRRLALNQSSTLLTLEANEYFFEVIVATDLNIVLFGAGHVARAVVRILAELPCRISWIDSREEEFPSAIPHGVEKRVTDFPEEEVARVRAGSYFLVMTHSHQLDQAICERILRRHDFAYFGLIGSMSKRRQFERRLMARGITAVRLADMRCPIGDNVILSKQPMAIAVAAVAELLQRSEMVQRARLSVAPASLVDARQDIRRVR